MHWRRKWQPTPVFLPGGSQGWGSLVGCRLWGHTESDTTEVISSSSSIGKDSGVDDGCICHISKQSVLQLSVHQPLQCPQWCTLNGFRMEKNRILAPDKSAYQRNNFHEPRLLHLPIHRKGLKFINLRYLFFLNSILLIFL